jgi:pSer/pThr/pTyr-binding forkhead associated (FHA) protein
MIGRGPENDLNLNDSSISRSHCSLFYTCNKMLLKGLPSKYGTFIELGNNFELTQS